VLRHFEPQTGDVDSFLPDTVKIRIQINTNILKTPSYSYYLLSDKTAKAADFIFRRYQEDGI